MNEPRKAGRPKKHLEDEHHFHTASEAENAVDEAIVENPTPSTDIVENVGVIGVQQPVSLDLSIQEADFVEIEEPHVRSAPIFLNGWNPMETDVVLSMPPRNGMPIRLSETPEGDGSIGFWKRVRAFANPTKRWEETGKWFDFTTGVEINFEPKYWKERF